MGRGARRGGGGRANICFCFKNKHLVLYLILCGIYPCLVVCCILLSVYLKIVIYFYSFLFISIVSFISESKLFKIL